MNPHQLTVSTAALLLALLPAAPVSALPQDLFELTLEELGNIPITGATRTAKSLRDVPAAVTIFTRNDLRALGVNTLEELMNRVPGLQSFRSAENGMAYSSSIRGRRIAAGNREILVLLNGMKIDGFYGGGTSSTLPLLPLDNIARAEFIRGPGSAIYGSNAYTGVINLITVDNLNQIALSTGDNLHREGFWQHSFSTEQASGAAFLHGRDDRGERYRVPNTLGPGQLDTRDPYRTANLQLQLQLGEDTRIQFIGAQTKAEDYYVLGNLHNGFNQYEYDFAGLMVDQALHWHDDISSQLAIGAKYSRLAPQGTVTALPGTGRLGGITDIRSDEWWLEWRNDWRLSERDSVQFGGEYRRPGVIRADSYSNYDLEELASGNFPLTVYEDFSVAFQINKEFHQDVIGLYSQWQREWNEQWHSIAGLRYDTYSQIGNNLSPRLGLLFHANAHNTFKLLYGEAFRAPQAGELYTINNPVIRGNSALEPETVTTAELIWLWHWHQGHLSVNYFYNVFKDAIDQNLVNGVRVYDNGSDRDTSDGVEVEWRTEIMPGWQWRATATWLLKTPETFFREARDLYSFSLLYDRARLFGSISGFYHSDRQALRDGSPARTRLDAHWVLDAKAGYRWTPQLRTEIIALNLLDETYFTPTQTTRIENGAPNRGRELRVGFTWDY